jgi:hypothetical protein
MSNQEPQNQNKTTEETAVEKRRRFIKGAGIAAPVIMALANRPAFGAVCTVSGFISVDPGNVSAQGHVVQSCSTGLTPGAYQTPYSGAGKWSGKCGPGGKTRAIHPEGEGKRTPPTQGTLMKDGFGFDGLLKDKTMYDVLWLSGNGDPYQLCAHLVAALLNAQGGLYINGLTEAEVKDMYKQMSQTGKYQAAPGVLWDEPTLVGFLKNTMH